MTMMMTTVDNDDDDEEMTITLVDNDDDDNIGCRSEFHYAARYRIILRCITGRASRRFA